jgi:hypothetical protein
LPRRSLKWSCGSLTDRMTYKVDPLTRSLANCRQDRRDL